MSARRFSVFGFAAILVISPLLASADVEIEAQVREYFSDIPVMAEIAACESKFTQFGTSGAALRGGMSGKMIGIFQIYEDIHAEYAKGLGMDIYTVEGNLAYARRLYEREGTKPWLSSFPCWGLKFPSAEHAGATLTSPMAPASQTSATLSVNLSLGTEHPQVLTLQKLLNGNGFVLTNEGPGSPGNETQKYGSLTRSAVRRFQCAQKIVCEGDEHSSGYGFVGPRTRAALLALNAPLAATATAQPTISTSTTSSGNHAGATNTGATSVGDAEAARLQAQIEELTKKLHQLLTEG